MAEIFNLCSVPKNSSDVQYLIDMLSDDLGTMAMVDYPYPTQFVADLPAWPVNYACDQAKTAYAGHATNQSLYGLSAAAQTFYNYS
jgi:hypothetical protein